MATPQAFSFKTNRVDCMFTAGSLQAMNDDASLFMRHRSTSSPDEH